MDQILGTTLSVCGLDLEILPTPGHSINQVAVLTADAAFLGDAVVAPALLERYPIQYCYDVPAHRATLERLAGLRKTWYVGAHFPPTQDLEGLVAANRRNLERTADAVLAAVAPAATTEEVVAGAAEALGVLSMDAAGLSAQRRRDQGPPLRPRPRRPAGLRDRQRPPPLASPLIGSSASSKDTRSSSCRP